MAIKQISVFAENKKGSIYRTTSVIAANGLDIRALSIADTMDFGILRMIVENTDKAVQILKDNGSVISVNDVIAVAMDDVPGGLSGILEVIAAEGVNIEYLYAFITNIEGKAFVVLRVTDNDSAEKALSAKGFTILTQADMENI